MSNSKNYEFDHSQSPYSTPHNQFEVIPLTPSAPASTTDDANDRRMQQATAPPEPRSGWASSMSLFSSSAATSPKPLTSESARRNNNSNNSNNNNNRRRPYGGGSNNNGYGYGNHNQNRNQNKTTAHLFREPTVNRTVQTPLYHFKVKSPVSPDERRREYDHTAIPNIVIHHNHDDDDDDGDDGPNGSIDIPNPWMPRIESLTSPSSIASSTSTFVFGRRPSLRSEISRQGSVSSAITSTSAVSSILNGANFLSSRRMLPETSPVSSSSSSDPSATTEEGMEVLLSPTITDLRKNSSTFSNAHDNVCDDDLESQNIPPADTPQSWQVRLRQYHQSQHENSQHSQTSQSQQSSTRLSSIVEDSISRVGALAQQAGGGVVRVGGIAQTELRQLARQATCSTQRVLRHRPSGDDGHPLSPIMEPWHDLEELQDLHKSKMNALHSESHDEMETHYDFALVLTPQAVYEFWADRLDFRAEWLGNENATFPPTNQSDDTEDTLPNLDENNHKQDYIDARPLFATPQHSGMRRRRTPTKSSAASKSTTSPASSESSESSESSTEKEKLSEKKSIWSAGIPDTPSVLATNTKAPRLSLFEKAVGVFTPSGRRLSTGEWPTTASTRNLFGASENTTPQALQRGSAPAPPPPPSTMTRRRWGNRRQDTPDSASQLRRKRSASPQLQRMSNGSNKTPDKVTPKRRKTSIDNIPSQVVPRGIAARSNGMMQFLSALKRGIVVRRHRPGQEAIFIKLTSNDGGDTVKFEHVDRIDEAMMAFREQRVRYNRKKARAASNANGMDTSLSQRWSHYSANNLGGDEDEENQHFELPDYIAAEQYRRKEMVKKKGGRHLQKTVVDAATKLKNSTSVKTQDVIAVHPGRHEDPRCQGQLATSSLRKSKSDFDPQFAFSIVVKSKHHYSKKNTSEASERWHSGEGNDAQFRSLDLEAATEGEYWLVFRGFLLLHRDAASGRFAAHRAAGFGSSTNKEDSDNQNKLQANTFHEPRTIGMMEQKMAKMRKIDLSLELNGSAEAGAVPPPSDYFLGFRSPGTQIWSRLRQAGLETTRIYAIDPRRVMIKVRCPVDRLTDVAEVLRIKLKKKDKDGYAPFREVDMAMFEPLTDDELMGGEQTIYPYNTNSTGASLFRSAERQKVIDFIIRSRIRDSGAELGQSTDLGKMILVRVPLHMTRKLDSLYNAWFHFYRREHWAHTVRDDRDTHGYPEGVSTRSLGGLVPSNRSVITEHSANSPRRRRPVTSVPAICSRFIVGAFFQPLDSIEQYFGEQVAFYFAWLQHCSCHLIFLSIVGFIVSIFQFTSETWDHPIRPFFSLVVMIWSFYVLVNWRQRSNLLAYRWGTMDHKVQETTRPQYKGEYRRDEITGEWIIVYPSWKRYLKFLVSFPITLGFTIGTLILILMVHAIRDAMLARYFDLKEDPTSTKFDFEYTINLIGATKSIQAVELTAENMREPNFWFIVAGLPCLLGLCLPLLNFILMRISILLNDFENYRTESHYRTALIVKVFSFRFVCYFATLYYYCFLSTDSPQAIENGILRVGSGVFIYMTVAHHWGIFLGTYFPLLIYTIRRRSQKKRLHEELSQVEREEAELEDLSADEMNNEDIKEKKVHLINKRLLLDQAQDDLWNEVMLPQHDSFPDYIQAVVQFAYVTCFSVVLPITPIICLMNHLISMRFGAYKLCKTRKRPLSQKTGGIGVWEHVLHIVSVIAILTNCWLMGFTNAQFVQLADAVGQLGFFAILVGWEHVMLLIKYVIQTTSAKLPKSVRDKVEKEQYIADRKRNLSMRAKKDRRSSTRDLGVVVSPTGTGSFSPRPPAAQPTGSILRRRMPSAPGTGPHGLMTIPSEDISEASVTPKSLASSGGKQQKQQQQQERTPLGSLDRNANKSKSTAGDSQDIFAPTPCCLGMPMEAEARLGDADRQSLLDKKPLVDRFGSSFVSPVRSINNSPVRSPLPKASAPAARMNRFSSDSFQTTSTTATPETALRMGIAPMVSEQASAPPSKFDKDNFDTGVDAAKSLAAARFKAGWQGNVGRQTKASRFVSSENAPAEASSDLFEA